MAHVPKPITERYLRWHIENYLNRYFTSTAHLKRLLMRRVRRSAEYWGSDSRSRADTDARVALERARGWSGKPRFKASSYGDDDLVSYDRGSRPPSGWGNKGKKGGGFGGSSFGKSKKKKKGTAYESEAEEPQPAPRAWLIGTSPTQQPRPQPVAPVSVPATVPAHPVAPVATPSNVLPPSPPRVPHPPTLSAYARPAAPASPASIWGQTEPEEDLWKDDLWNMDMGVVREAPATRAGPSYATAEKIPVFQESQPTITRPSDYTATAPLPDPSPEDASLEDPGAEDEPPEGFFEAVPTPPPALTIAELLDEGSKMIDKILSEATENGQLNDDRFAASKIRTMARRGISARGIAARLSAKGLTEDQVEAGMNELKAELGGDPEVASAAALIRKKKLGPYRPAATRRDSWQRDLGVLARAGFSFDLARRLLGTESPDALDEMVDASGSPENFR